MLTTMTPSAQVWPIIKSVFQRPASLASSRHATQDDQPQDTRARRDFINEALRRDPGAFSSELDVQFMMQAYPDRF